MAATLSRVLGAGPTGSISPGIHFPWKSKYGRSPGSGVWSNNAVGRTLASHMSYPSSLSSTPYGPLSLTRSEYRVLCIEYRARNKPGAPLGVAPKQKQNTNKKEGLLSSRNQVKQNCLWRRLERFGNVSWFLSLSDTLFHRSR